MKRMLMIGIFWVFAMTACTLSVKNAEPIEPAETSSQNLATIDSLMWQQPDSALAVLMDYLSDDKDTACQVSTNETFDNHYAQLLASELLYKNDYAQTNRTELQQAVAYFDSLVREAGGFKTPRNRNGQLVFLAARAHYINGVGYYENDSVVEACTEYIKALETMEGNFEEKELARGEARLMALTHTHITALFSRFYLHEQAVYFGKKSLDYYRKYDASPRHVAWILNEIGAQYDMMDSDDTAFIYYCNALNILPDTNNITYRDIITHLAFLSYKKGGLSSASLKLLKEIATKAESDKEFFSRCMNIGEIFYHEKLLDSAWFYLSSVFHESQNVNSRKQAAEWLVEICKAQQRNEEIVEYADFLVPFANQEENKSEIKSRLTELYKTYNQGILERQHQKDKQIHAKQALLSVVGLVFITLIIGLLFHKNRRHNRNLETLIESERKAHKMQQAALAGRLKRSNAALKEQTGVKQVSNSPTKHTVQQRNAMNYEEEAVCQQILALCNDKKNPIKSTVPISAYAGIALNDKQKAQLKDAALQHHGSMFEKLKQQHPELKEKDFQYCYLCLLGLDNIQIAVLLQNSISTIWEREKRLKKILCSEERIAINLRGYMIT